MDRDGQIFEEEIKFKFFLLEDSLMEMVCLFEQKADFWYGKIIQVIEIRLV
jgi:hypothetical protein